MPPVLDLDLSALVVRYRASPLPQLVDVHIAMDRAPRRSYPALALPFLVRAINAGAAGGAELAPAAGAARIVKGLSGPEDFAPRDRLSFRLELAGVSPYFLRLVVERLALAGPGARVTGLSIVGALPVDASPLSVTELQMRSWLSRADAYPGAWTPSFSVRTRPISRGAAVRASLAGDADQALLLRFTELIELWNQAIMTVWNASSELVGVADAAPRMSRGKGELAAGYDAFDFLRPPAEAILVNMLERFHGEVAPIRDVWMALS